MQNDLDRVPSSPPLIRPVTDGHRPIWSVMIPVYNSIPYLQETLNAVLQQALPENEMQITVVDDGSNDGDVKGLVQTLGKGRIEYISNPGNLGSVRTFERCINAARGEWVHLLHADDLVEDGYYSAIRDLFRQWPEAGAAFCRFKYINEERNTLYVQPGEAAQAGILDNWLYKISVRNRIQFAAITVKRVVYEQLGSFYGLTYGEDWEMWVRIAAHYPVAYTPEVLAEYRKHEESITGKKFFTGDFLDDLLQAMKMIQHHLPEKMRPAVMSESKKFYSMYGMRTAQQLWQSTHDKKSAKNVAIKSLKMHQSFPGWWEALKLFTKFILQSPATKVAAL
ncbi:MAG: glycosyltransferase family 2 protein [Candidatus Dadabacteria bacterium]